MTDDRPSASLDNVIVVLSHTTEPMNIGATCRAMKTMGLRNLRLISPLNPKGRSARALAHGAEDILDSALVVDTLMEAIGDCQVVTGTTARPRQLRKHALLTPAEMSGFIADHAREGKVALLFGTERTGLTNDETDICRYLSTVDTAPEQPSLNLAQAVMLYGWEIRQAVQQAGGATERTTQLPPRGEGVRRPEMRVRHPHRSTKVPDQRQLDTMYAHLAYTMEHVEYSPAERLKFLTYLRQLHQRAGIVDWETHIYHIFCARILKSLDVPKFDGVIPDDLDEGDDPA